jgi:hypothetical protein
MLETLFGSKTRVQLLRSFLLEPKKKYYIRQLSRQLDIQLNAIRRELENLENFGLLKSEKSSEKSQDGEDVFAEEPDKGKCSNNSKNIDRSIVQEKKFYRVNTDFILFEELRALILKSQVLNEKKYLEKLLKIGKVQLMVLCGIFVNDFDSPIDILIVGGNNRNRIVDQIRDMEREVGREINFTIMDMEEFKYRRDMTDVFLYSILEGKKIKLIDELGLA